MPKIWISIFIAVAVFGGLFLYVSKHSNRPPDFELYVFKVKSGTSMFIRGPHDERILVNGGSNSEVIRYLTRILPFYSKRIDYVVCTDSNYENSSGLVDVVKRFKVGELLVPAHSLYSLGLASTSDRTFDDLLNNAKEKRIKIRSVQAGDDLTLGSLEIKAYFPESPETISYSRASAPEIIFSVLHKDTSILFAGNSSRKIQGQIASSINPELNNILVYAHSDSSNLVSDSMIRRFKPSFLIYSKVTSSKQKKETKAGNLLSGILNKNRFNVKQGSVKLVANEGGLQIRHWK